MDKFGVETIPQEKTAGDQPPCCPKCGCLLEDSDGMLRCPECGTEPFEKKS